MSAALSSPCRRPVTFLSIDLHIVILDQATSSSGETIFVEEVRYLNASPRLVIRLGRSPHLQSILPPFPGFYTDSLSLVPWRGSLMVVGVAGGTAGHLAREMGFRRIYGIESDSEMLRLGRRHFRLDDVFDSIVLGDAYDFQVWSQVGWRNTYSCIFFDAYRGLEHSTKLYQVTYLRFLLSRLEEGGRLLINATSYAKSLSLSTALELVGAGIRWDWHQYGGNWVADVYRV